MTDTNMSTIQEKLLVLRAQAREEGAFQELVIQYERRILYYIHRILGDDKNQADVMQEIWMRVFLKLTTLRTPEAFRVWLYRIAHDVTVSQLRKHNRHQAAQLTDEDQSGMILASDWNELEQCENAELVHQAMGLLSLPHREVLTLRFLEELDISDISEVVGCSVGTVKSRLHYAKAAMRRILEVTHSE